MIEAELRDYLIGMPGISDLIKTRIFPAPLPQSVEGEITADLPAVTYADISEVSNYASGADTGFRKVRYQLDSIAPIREDARSVDDLIRQALSGYRGTWASFNIQAVLRRNSFSRYEPEVELWRIVTDYEFMFTCN